MAQEKDKQKKAEEEELPTLEIKPSQEYHERPMWQRVLAWILIVMVVAATGVYALWGKLV